MCLLAASFPPPTPFRPQVLTAACEVCKKSIEGAKGKLTVKEAARAVSERDDRLLAERMEALEAANREVSDCHGGRVCLLKEAVEGWCVCCPVGDRCGVHIHAWRHSRQQTGGG